ncbi:MAG: tyrosine-type recombinase/integrase [Nocardioides sp.]
MSGSSSFRHLVEVWLADLDLEDKLAPSTRDLYERNMEKLVMPAFANYTLREITVRKVDQFIKTLASTKSYSTAKQARTVLSLAFGLAVRYDAIPRNPVRDTVRLQKPPSQAQARTVEQIDVIRTAARSWRRGAGFAGPPPDGQLEQVIEVMLGTSARIGEVLAIRKCDVDVTDSPATVRICGTIVSPKGKPTHRQPHPKTQKSTRTVSVPSFAAEVLRQRLVLIAGEEPEHLIFFSHNHTPLTTNNLRRRLLAVLEDVEIEGVTPPPSGGPLPRSSTVPAARTWRPRCSGTRPARSPRSTTSSLTRPSTRSRQTFWRRWLLGGEVARMPSDHEESAEDRAEVSALPG